MKIRLTEKEEAETEKTQIAGCRAGHHPCGADFSHELTFTSGPVYAVAYHCPSPTHNEVFVDKLHIDAPPVISSKTRSLTDPRSGMTRKEPHTKHTMAVLRAIKHYALENKAGLGACAANLRVGHMFREMGSEKEAFATHHVTYDQLKNSKYGMKEGLDEAKHKATITHIGEEPPSFGRCIAGGMDDSLNCEPNEVHTIHSGPVSAMTYSCNKHKNVHVLSLSNHNVDPNASFVARITGQAIIPEREHTMAVLKGIRELALSKESGLSAEADNAKVGRLFRNMGSEKPERDAHKVSYSQLKNSKYGMKEDLEESKKRLRPPLKARLKRGSLRRLRLSPKATVRLRKLKLTTHPLFKGNRPITNNPTHARFRTSFYMQKFKPNRLQPHRWRFKKNRVVRLRSTRLKGHTIRLKLKRAK